MQPIDPVLGHRRSGAFVQVSHGLHRPRTIEADPRGDLLAWQLLLGDESCFTHLTAASIYRWWLPPLPVRLPVFAAVSQERRIRRAGLLTSRHHVLPTHHLRDGLRVAEPPEALLSCGRHLGVLDLVVLLDAALHLQHCSVAEIERVLEHGRPGTAVLRAALRLADGRSESPWESMLRVLHTSCGIPVEPQRVIRDADGVFVARADLHLLGTHTLHEYDGAVHRTRQQHRRDLARERRLAAVQWTRRGYTSLEVLQQAATIIRDADQSLGRPHDPRRLGAWNRLVTRSLFTPAGTAAFVRRLGPEQRRPSGRVLQMPPTDSRR